MFYLSKSDNKSSRLSDLLSALGALGAVLASGFGVSTGAPTCAKLGVVETAGAESDESDGVSKPSSNSFNASYDL